MDLTEAIESRFTCRGFLDVPVPETTVRTILAGAARSPSGGNLQPWHVWAVAGEELARLKATVRTRMASGEIYDGKLEYEIYPEEMKEPYIGRRFRNGEAVYAALGISRDNREQRLQQLARNFEFFGAPTALFFAIDRSMQPAQWADLGMFMQSVMLLAREYGLHTAPLESWSFRYKTVGEFLQFPDEMMLFCGMAIGHMDPSNPVNHVRVDRAPLDEFAVFRGFHCPDATSAAP